jgi:hypothetical protein
MAPNAGNNNRKGENLCLQADFPSTNSIDERLIPCGDEQSLQAVCDEIMRFSGKGRWTATRQTTAKQMISDIAESFLQFKWGESDQEPISQPEVTKGCKEVLTALKHAVDVANENAFSVIAAGKYHKRHRRVYADLIERNAFALSMVEQLCNLQKPFISALATTEFKRRGRASTGMSAYLYLVTATRDVTVRLCGRAPGFSRATDASSGPLVRIVGALYRYATGRDAPKSTFNQYIAQAEKRSKRGQTNELVAVRVESGRRHPSGPSATRRPTNCLFYTE